MQNALSFPATFTGFGLHSGLPVRMTVRPAAADHGIWFRRLDMTGGDPLVPARWDHVTPAKLCTVIENAPWNLQLAEEMNSWNNMWTNCKLVREEGNLFVVADVPITSLEVLRDSVRDLVQKASNVNDVVAVFM